MSRRIGGLVVVALCALFAGGIASAQAPAPAVPEAPATANPDAPAPRIKFEAVVVDLGEVVHGEDAVATFTFRNTGNAPLHILSAKPG